MDVTSYLLGKNASGGSTTLQDKEVTITTNTTTTIEADTGYDGLNTVEVTTNVGGGIDDYFLEQPPAYSGTIQKILKKIPPIDLSNNTSFNFQNASNLEEIEGITGTSQITNMTSMFYECQKLKAVPLFDTSNATNMSNMFYDVVDITTVPQFDTSNVTNMNSMFYCGYTETTGLVNLPLLNTSKVTNFGSMLYGRKHLSDQSLDNVLQMCINATSFTGTKSLTSLGMYGGYPTSKIISLPHYQDFTDAGWIIGF